MNRPLALAKDQRDPALPVDAVATEFSRGGALGKVVTATASRSMCRLARPIQGVAQRHRVGTRPRFRHCKTSCHLSAVAQCGHVWTAHAF
jgi:hypothetical protein